MLVSQSAMAIHVDELDAGNKDRHYSQPADQHDEVADSCNHFCHASAHLVGLFSDNLVKLHVNRESYIATSADIIDSHNDQPSIPPPIF